MSRVYNFSAGPAVLPEEVLKEVAEEMMDYQGSGMSVMEMSHRSADFQKIIDEAEQDLRDLMKIPDNYKVLFLQGGASQQFAAIPMKKQIRSLLPRIRLSPIFLTAVTFRSARMQTMYTFVKTTQSTEQNSRNFPTQKEKLW